MSTLAQPLPPPTLTQGNPYVGPRPMRFGESIHGRTREIAEIRGLLISNRVVLLYSPSGAGKTSLIEAGLVPQLKQRDFVVFPTIRVGYELGSAEYSGANRYSASVIASLEERLEPEQQLTSDVAATTDLGAYLAHVAEETPEGRLCLVFDQFEEVFTLNPADVDAKREFIEQLGTALRSRRFWVLIAMREDFIAQLDPYLASLPTQLRTRFRLGLLGPEAALEAARAPAKDHGVDFQQPAAEKLIDDLRQIQVQHFDGTRREPGPHVEPLQLQVVCRRLWTQRRADSATIGVDDVTKGGGVNEALSSYYIDEVDKVDDETGATEREVRRWFSRELITEDGFRKPVRKGPGKDGEAVIKQLADAHLIRGERRGGTDWYELTHDRFVEPIRTSNREFETARRTKLTWIGLAIALLVSAVVVAFVAVTLDSDDAQFTAEAVDVSDEPINVELDPGEFTRFLVDPSDVEVVEATLRYAGESSRSTAQLRLLGVDGQLGAEIAAASLKRVAAGQPAEESAEGAPEPASQSLGAQETAVVRRTVIEADSSLVFEVASESGGNFLLTIAATAGQGGPIELGIDGDPVEAEIGAAGDVVTGSLQGAAADESVRVVVTPAEQFDAVVLVRTGSGTEVGFADLGSEGDDEVLTFTVPAADELLIEVSGYDGSTGGFVLDVETVDSTELEIGGPAAEGVVDGEIAAFTVRGSAGGAIRVSLSPQPGFDPVLRLVASDGSTSVVDIGGDGADETLTAVVGADGTRVIEVLGFEGSTGEFSIAVAPIEARPLDLDETVSGTIDASRPFDTYRVTIPTGTTIESFDVVGRDGLELSLEISTQFYGSVAFDMTDLIDEGLLDDMQALWQEVDFYDDEEWLVTVSGLRATSGAYDLKVTTAP